jgi:CHAD domain-containing protein
MKPPSISKYARDETRVCLKHFKTNLRRAAKHSGDPDAIHDLRVSIRRLTQCLRIFRSLLDPAPVKKLRRRLHKVMQHCGAVRNCDIALELLEECGLAESPSVSKLKNSRRDAEQKLHRKLKKEQRRHHRALRAAARPPHRDWQIAIRLPALAKDFFHSGSAAAARDSDYQTLHRFRLRAKRFRYTLELFERFYGSEMATGAKLLKGLQDRLGAINDCVTTVDLLADDPRAVTAIQQLLDQRTRAFQSYWLNRFTPQKLGWWQRWLSLPRTELLKHPPASTASSGTAAHRG